MFEEEDNIPVQIRLQIGMNKLSVQHHILLGLEANSSVIIETIGLLLINLSNLDGLSIS